MEYALRFIIILLIVPVFFLLWGLSKALGARSWTVDRTLNCCGAIYQAFFIGVVVVGVLPFQCFDHPNHKASLVAFPEILCGEGGSHSTLVVLGIGLIAGVVVPITAVDFWATCVAGKKSVVDEHFLIRFRFLLYRFRPDTWWWGPVLAVRQLFLAFAPIVQTHDPSSQITYCAVVFVVYQSALCRYLPWKAQEVNILDATSGVILSMLVVSAGSFLPQSDWGVGHNFIMVLLLIFFVVGAAFMLFYVGASFFKNGLKGQLGKGLKCGTFNFKSDPAESGKDFINLCNSVLSLCSEDRKLVDEMFKEMNEYDIAALRQVISLLQNASAGYIDVSKAVPMRVMTAATSETLKAFRKSGSRKSSDIYGSVTM